MPTRTAKTTKALPVLNPHAAGIAVGATEVYVAVPEDRAAPPVRSFVTCTQDLHALADWLHAGGIQTVAMAARGVYWSPLCPILESRGIEVCLVNSRQVKNVPGRKSDGAGTARGCSTYTPWDSCAPPFARRKPSVPCAPCSAIVIRWSPTRLPISSIGKRH